MHYIGTEITNTTINIYNMYKTSERGYKSYKPGVQTRADKHKYLYFL